MDRRHEVLAVVKSGAGPDDAVAEVAQLLAVNEVGARAVLDAQVRRFTVRERARILEERDRLRDLVARSLDGLG